MFFQLSRFRISRRRVMSIVPRRNPLFDRRSTFFVQAAGAVFPISPRAGQSNGDGHGLRRRYLTSMGAARETRSSAAGRRTSTSGSTRGPPRTMTSPPTRYPEPYSTGKTSPGSLPRRAMWSTPSTRTTCLQSDSDGMVWKPATAGAMVSGSATDIDLTLPCSNWGNPVNCESLRVWKPRFGTATGPTRWPSKTNALDAFYRSFFGKEQFYVSRAYPAGC